MYPHEADSPDDESLGCFASLRSDQGTASLAASPIPAHLSFGNGFEKPFPNAKSENRTPYIDRLPNFGRRSFSIHPSESRRSCTMAKQKTIPDLEAEKAENERKLSQLQHKSSSLKTVSPTTKKVIGASGRTTLSPVVQPLKASHR